jgi:hypothetical protein
MRLGQESLKPKAEEPGDESSERGRHGNPDCGHDNISPAAFKAASFWSALTAPATFSTISAYIPRHLVADIFRLIDELRPPPVTSTA